MEHIFPGIPTQLGLIQFDGTEATYPGYKRQNLSLDSWQVDSITGDFLLRQVMFPECLGMLPSQTIVGVRFYIDGDNYRDKMFDHHMSMTLGAAPVVNYMPKTEYSL